MKAHKKPQETSVLFSRRQPSMRSDGAHAPRALFLDDLRLAPERSRVRAARAMASIVQARAHGASTAADAAMLAFVATVDRERASLAERALFDHPRLYRLKYFLIETVIWRWLFAGLLRREVRPIPTIDEMIQGKHVLLAACGPGDVSTGPPLAAAARVAAFDVSEEFVAACRSRRPAWEVFSADILQIPRPDRSCDVSAVYSSLHHVPAGVDAVLAELARVARERIIVVEGVVPECGLLRRVLLLWYRLVDGGARYYTRAELLAAAARLGLQVERATPHGPIGHMLLLVLRVAPASEPGETGERQSTPPPAP
jgi:SAM-dependent methyltransferase